MRSNGKRDCTAMRCTLDNLGAAESFTQTVSRLPGASFQFDQALRT
jgi:hypothetical protein